MSFSRGLYTGWFRGIDNQKLAHGRFGTKRGVFLGEVLRVSSDHVAATLEAPLKPGDGVVFDAGNPGTARKGGRVYQVTARGAETVLRFGQGDIDFPPHPARPPDLEDQRPRARSRGARHLRRRQDPVPAPHRRRGARQARHPADAARSTTARGTWSKLESALPLGGPEQPLTEERLRDQLGRLGGTPFRLGAAAVHLEGPVILPVSELNRMRRDAAAELEQLRAAARRWTLEDTDRESLTTVASAETNCIAAGRTGADRVIRLLTSWNAAWAAGARTIYCEFENPKHYREAVARFRTLQIGFDRTGQHLGRAAAHLQTRRRVDPARCVPAMPTATSSATTIT
jgi:putative protease